MQQGGGKTSCPDITANGAIYTTARNWVQEGIHVPAPVPAKDKMLALCFGYGILMVSI